MDVSCFVSVLVLVKFLLAGRSYGAQLPEEHMNVSQMIAYHGYSNEIHEVITEDGYILTLQRIPHGKKAKNGQPVFLQHGFIDSAATWIMNPPNQSLAFVLADAGYDVWLGNSRGNPYSTKHIKYNTDDTKFWDFSFDEMAKYDLPASINYILKVTGRPEIYYVGHSQGTTIGFIEFGRNPELGKKIKTFFGLAPVATVGHIKGGMKVMSTMTPEIEFMIKLLGLKELLPSNPLIKFLAHKLCGAIHFTEEVCGNLLFLVAGFDKANLNVDRVPVYLSHMPASTSVKDMIHYLQMVKNGKFQMFDYGPGKNNEHYNQSSVPQYNLKNVKTPVALFTGGHDWLADPDDVNLHLKPNLTNIIFSKNIPSWNHLDFVWGVDAHQVIYKDLIRIMDQGL